MINKGEESTLSIPLNFEIYNYYIKEEKVHCLTEWVVGRRDIGDKSSVAMILPPTGNGSWLNYARRNVVFAMNMYVMLSSYNRILKSTSHGLMLIA